VTSQATTSITRDAAPYHSKKIYIHGTGETIPPGFQLTRRFKLNMPRSRSHSPSDSPRQRDRARSRSPRRRQDDDVPRRKGAGFKWKEKRRDDISGRDGDHDRGLQRGYRDHYRPRSRSPRLQDKQDKPVDKHTPSESEHKEKKEKKDKKPTQPAAPAEPMIIVNVNDRLGTKAAIPCLASDPIKLFKAQVAARVGREPHEILLKRQGERPFKDQLTLADYGVSNGVQLDLYVCPDCLTRPARWLIRCTGKSIRETDAKQAVLSIYLVYCKRAIAFSSCSVWISVLYEY
jgi:hypothetical protein